MTSNVKKKVVRRFAPEFRREAADQVISQGRSVKDVAEGLGIPPATLFTWVSKFRSGQWAIEFVKSQGPARQQPSRDQLTISELQAQLRRVTQERDILKKAAAYFAQNLG